MLTSDLDFHLPPELIAQEPPAVRSDARMLHYDRNTQTITHRHVRDLPELLRAGDLLVFNNTVVAPARFTLRKPTGGLIEGLWLNDADPADFAELAGGDGWLVLLKGLGKIWPTEGLELLGDSNTRLRVLRKVESGYLVAVDHPYPRSTDGLFTSAGRMPLPPYIKRAKGQDPRDADDRQRYQTVFNQGSYGQTTAGMSVAAPTAGLHFDPELLLRLGEAEVDWAHVTLQVGMGTFRTVETDTLEEHRMHVERWQIDPAAADALNRRTGRTIAVGTTAVRTLESQPPGDLRPGSGETDLLIQPPYTPRHVDALITNFHLPKSTLIALVDGFIGTEARRRIYDEAIRERYRFFSYGDCMLIE